MILFETESPDCCFVGTLIEGASKRIRYPLQRRIGDKTVTDPTLQEEKELSTSPSKRGDEFSLTIGYLPSLDQVAALLQEGTTSSETLVAEVRS